PCILHPPPASCLPPPASRLLHPASRLPPPASCILHPASRIGPLSLAQIRYRDGEAFDPVFQATDVAGVSSDQDADPGEWFSGFAKFVLDHHHRLRFAVDV